MSEEIEPTESAAYPLGRGYGHDYMRGGEVLGGYGYSERDGYERRRGENDGDYRGEERRMTAAQPPSDNGADAEPTS